MAIKNKKNLFLVLSLIAILAFGSWWFFIRGEDAQRQIAQGQDTVTADDPEINYNPPTEEESQRGNDKKQDIDAEEPSPETEAPPTTQKKEVTPTITGNEVYGNNLEVSGYVHGIVEKGGTCTAVATRESVAIRQERAALDDAQYTSCGVILIPKSKLNAGTWRVVLEYESAKYSGTSATSEVVIQ